MIFYVLYSDPVTRLDAKTLGSLERSIVCGIPLFILFGQCVLSRSLLVKSLVILNIGGYLVIGCFFLK